VRGLREADLKQLKAVSSNIRFGTLDGFDKEPGVALGTRLANDLNVKVGDQVSLLTPRGPTTAIFGTAPRVKRYPVVAIFEIGMSEYDASIIFMPLNEAQLYFSQPDSVTVLEVVLDSPDEVGKLGPQIISAGGPGIYISDWRQRNATFFTALEVERNVMFLILALIVLVAALNIISGLIMLVKDKGRDIAILRTMGATRASVMRVFFITGATIGIVGTLAGFALGVLVCVNIEYLREFIGWLTDTELFAPELYYLSQLPAEMDTGETASVVIMALILSILATLYPSWRASRLDPVEALRYE
jgi:lipoprotein-releasing system permease protein